MKYKIYIKILVHLYPEYDIIHLMKNIVQEYLVVFRYDSLDQESYFAIYKELDDFLATLGTSRWHLVETMNMPVVTIPQESVIMESPDWSKMKIFLDRRYRYRTSDDKVLIQFCKDFMTVNVAKMPENDYCEPSFDRLYDELKSLLPFIRDKLGHAVTLRNLQYESVYHLKKDHLSPLLASKYNPKLQDYLDIFGLLRSFAQEVNRDVWELEKPLRQELVYHIKDDKLKKIVGINTFVNSNDRCDWFANINIKVCSKVINDMKGQTEKIDAFNQSVPSFHDYQIEGLRRLLTDKMLGYLEVSKP